MISKLEFYNYCLLCCKEIVIYLNDRQFYILLNKNFHFISKKLLIGHELWKDIIMWLLLIKSMFLHKNSNNLIFLWNERIAGVIIIRTNRTITLFAATEILLNSCNVECVFAILNFYKYFLLIQKFLSDWWIFLL